METSLFWKPQKEVEDKIQKRIERFQKNVRNDVHVSYLMHDLRVIIEQNLRKFNGIQIFTPYFAGSLRHLTIYGTPDERSITEAQDFNEGIYIARLTVDFEEGRDENNNIIYAYKSHTLDMGDVEGYIKQHRLRWIYDPRNKKNKKGKDKK